MVSCYKVIGFLGLMVVFGLTGCGGEQSASTSQSASTDSIVRPDTELSGARIYLYDKSRVTAEIVADKVLRFNTIDSSMAYKLDIDVYDSTGQVSTHVVGDSGIIRENTGRMYIYSHVVVISDSSQLESDYLFWDSKTDRIQTDAFVKVTQGENVFTGWGMEADQRLKSFKILRHVRQVSGAITDPKLLTEP